MYNFIDNDSYSPPSSVSPTLTLETSLITLSAIVLFPERATMNSCSDFCSYATHIFSIHFKFNTASPHPNVSLIQPLVFLIDIQAPAGPEAIKLHISMLLVF